MFLTFPIMVIRVNTIDNIVEWRWERMFMVGIGSFVLSFLWRYLLKRKELGKKIYSGQFARSENPAAAEEQRAALEALQARLPMRARNDVDLAGYAGQLDEEQYAALLYFLKKRFKVE